MKSLQIRLNVQKIHNWTDEGKFVELDLQFYSRQSQHLITRKHISALSKNKCLDLDIHLKIRYADNQNIIVISIKQTNHNCEDFGEVELNLDELRNKKITYLTFSKFQKVLQISIDKQPKQQNETRQNTMINPKFKRNKKFLDERNKFLQIFTETQNRLKSQFQQRIATIIKQEKPHRMRENFGARSKFLPRNTDLNTEQQFPQMEDMKSGYVHSQIKEKSEHKRAGTKSALEDKLGQREFKHEEINKIPYPKIPISRSPRSPNYAQAHKLVLNTLNIVPKQSKK